MGWGFDQIFPSISSHVLKDFAAIYPANWLVKLVSPIADEADRLPASTRSLPPEIATTSNCCFCYVFQLTLRLSAIISGNLHKGKKGAIG
jgi:hypothetical protein